MELWHDNFSKQITELRPLIDVIISFPLNNFRITPMPQINVCTGTVLKYETLANLFSAEFFSFLYLILS